VALASHRLDKGPAPPSKTDDRGIDHARFSFPRIK
jgi:hypothetical protein